MIVSETNFDERKLFSNAKNYRPHYSPYTWFFGSYRNKMDERYPFRDFAAPHSIPLAAVLTRLTSLLDRSRLCRWVYPSSRPKTK